jgi:pimeloyl-ACP methyl ester carboxylesterase
MMRYRAKASSTVLALLIALVLLPRATPARMLHYSGATSCVAPPATSPVYENVQEQVAETARGPIGYYRFGHGNPVLLITGYRADMAEWNATFLATLAAVHEVIIFDNRGIGRTMPDAASFTAQDMARDASALVGALQLRHLTVLGWSMGGVIAQRLAIETPHVTERLVLVSTLAPGTSGVPVAPDVAETLSGVPGTSFHAVMTVLFPAPALALAERCFAQEMYRPKDYQMPKISAAVTAGQAALLRAWAANDAAAAALAKLPVPTLILTGDDDAVVSSENATVLRHLLPHAELVTIAYGGHAMMYQYPVALAQEINAFAGP